jgi:hypothetical protein
MAVSGFISLEEVVEDACHAMDDYLLRNKMKFLRIGKRVWNDDLKLNSVKIPVRQFFQIDKRTNSIKMPCDFHHLSGVAWQDRNGQFHPMFRNDRLNDDIVDIKAKKDCACDCGGQLCNLIKSYESISEEVTVSTPQGGEETFTTMTIKGIDGNGWYYENKQFPIRIFEDGVWVQNELKTEKRELCKLELENGCPTDCEANIEAVTSCGCRTELVRITSKLDYYMVECGTWFSRGGEFKNIYNISEEGDRLLFPPDLPVDKVLVRFYKVNELKDIKVPLVARTALITGILYENMRFKTDRESVLLAREFSRKFANESFALIQELNRYNSAQKNAIMSPVAYIP